MRKSTSTLAALALAGATVIFGCENNTANTITQKKTFVRRNIEDGANRRVLAITSDQHYWNRKQAEVRSKVERFVNGGEHNVLSVKTFYSDAFLTSAEIQYGAGDDCNNQNLRIEFIHSDERYWNRKQAEIKPRLLEFINSGQRDVRDVNMVKLKGCLVAAEVYYAVE